MSSSQPKQSWTAGITPYLLYLIAIATLGPLQFGYHLAELNAPEKVIRCIDNPKSPPSAKTLPSIPDCIPMEASSFAVVSSIYTLGGLLGALSSGPLSSRYGRLLPLRLASIFFILGPLVSSLAPNIPVMAIGRFLSGIGAGAALVVVPIYISEIAPPQSKGMFGALTQVGTNIGILLTQVLGYFLSYGGMWRVVLGVAGGVAVVQAVGLLGVAESPQWLATKERVGYAKKVLRRVRGESSIEEEVGNWGTTEEEGEEEYEHLLSEQSRNSGTPKPKSSTESIGILQVIVHPDHYKAIIAVIGVMLAQQLCGINAVIMYSVSFLSDILPTTAGLITVAVGGLNLVVTIACAPLADRLGRKTCLLLSIAGMGINTLLLACAIVFGVKILSAIATLLIVASFAVGLGPIPFILANELVGPEAVGATQSWALAANWTATFLVAQFFPILNLAMGKGRVFFLFTGMAALFFAFVAYWVPETNGRSADEAWGRAERDRRED